MFKKRIRTWGLSRNMKSAEKDRLIQQHYSLPSSLWSSCLVRPRRDKVIRHAKHQAKLGLLDKQLTRDFVTNDKASDGLLLTDQSLQCQRSFDSLIHEANMQILLPHTVKAPDDLANTEKLLRALQISGEMLPSGSLCESAELGSGITALLDHGRTAWGIYAFSHARKHFSNAGVLLMRSLRGGQLPALAILRCLVMRKTLRCPGSVVFARFVISALIEVLGKHHVFVIAAQLMTTLPVDKAHQVVVWDSILDVFLLTPENVEQWCMAAYRRSRSLFTSGLLSEATDRCHAVIAQLEKASLMTTKWNIKFKNELARFAYAQLNIPAATTAYAELLELTAASPGEWAWLRALSHNILAEINEIDFGDLDRAEWHCLQGWNVARRFLDVQDPQLMRSFRDMLMVLTLRGCPEGLHTLVCCNQDLYSRLERSTSGLWRKPYNYDDTERQDSGDELSVNIQGQHRVAWQHFDGMNYKI